MTAALVIGSWIAVDAALIAALVIARRHFTRKTWWMGGRPSPAPLGCVMCDRPVAEDRVTCSQVCLDMWLGQIGAHQ